MSLAHVFFAEGFEEIEAVTVVDILRRAEIRVCCVSVSGKLEVTGSHGIRIITDALFDKVDHHEADVLILPGGMPGTDNLADYKPLCELLLSFAKEDKYIAAICAAPRILGKLGLLDGKTATCYPGYEDDLLGANISKASCVKSGKIITATCVDTALDFAAEIINAIEGKSSAKNLAR